MSVKESGTNVGDKAKALLNCGHTKVAVAAIKCTCLS